MKNKSLNTYLSSCILMALFIIVSTARLFSAEPINIQQIGAGEYIGKYIEYLNEKELFESAQHGWKIESIYKNKLLSGELHTDDVIDFKFGHTSSGYKAILKLHGNADNQRIVEWGINDILRENLSPQFIQSNRSILLLNFNPHAYWLRFKILHTGADEREIYLELDKHIFSLFDIYAQTTTGFIAKKSNFRQNLEEREVKYKNAAFKLRVKPGLNSYYLRLDTEGWLDPVPLRLWSKDDFSHHLYIDNLLQGIIIGVFILLFLYNIFIFISIRDIKFIYLSQLIITQLTLHLCFSGFGFQYLWPARPVASVYIVFLIFPIHFVFNLVFCRSFIEIQKYTPKIDILIRIMIYVFVIMGISSLVVPHAVKIKIFAATALIDFVYYLPLLFTCIVAIKKDNRQAVFLLIGLILYIVSQVEWILSNFDIIPYSLINYLHIKGISYILLMTLGLSYHFKTLKKTVTDLSVNLEDKVRERIGELQKNLKLKKTEKSVTDNTKIKIESVKEYIQENYTYDISREGLASAVDMSPDHLGRMFKQYTGEKISDYVNRLRIREASKKLIESDDKIIDIAFSVGYESLRTFNIIFVKIMKMSPSYYKNKKNK